MKVGDWRSGCGREKRSCDFALRSRLGDNSKKKLEQIFFKNCLDFGEIKGIFMKKTPEIYFTRN